MRIPKKTDAKPFKQTKFVRTHEDWIPSFEPLQVAPNPAYCNPENFEAMRVTISDFNAKEHGWHVSVWGSDDFGMDVWGLTKAEAKELYAKIVDYTCMAELKKLGLEIA